MLPPSFLGLVNNAAYLLALVLVYDSFSRTREGSSLIGLILQGILLGGIAVAVMSAPWVMRPGVIFDTRSVVLSLGGLFFGLVPTVIAMIIAGSFRLFQGGIGTLTGVCVVVSSGLIGLLWQLWRVRFFSDISGRELYCFGLIVAVNMLLWMLTFPGGVALQVLKNISLPVMLLYPVATLLMGTLLRDRMNRIKEHGALQRSEERFRVFYDLNLVGLAITSPTKGWLRVNQGLCGMLGFKEEELKSMTWAQLTHPDDLAADVRQFEKLLNGTINGYTMDKRFITRNGETVYTQLVVRCVRRKDGVVDYVVAMVADISERKRLEQELSRKEEQYRFLVENQRELLVSFDKNFQILYVNPAYCQTFGQSEEELIGANFLSHQNKDNLARLNSSPHSLRYQEQVSTVMGVRWFEWQVDASLDKTGSVVTAIGVGRDVTTQKEMEAALGQSLQEWRHAMDFLDDAVYIIDLDDTLVRANRAFFKLTGKSAEESIGLDIKSIIHPRGEVVPCPVCLARINHEDTFITMEADHKDNSTGKPIEIMVKMIRDENNEIISILIAIHDLSRQRQLEEEVRRHRDHLQEMVKIRTLELEKKNRQLEELNRYFVGREVRMEELKEEIAAYKEMAKMPPGS